MILTRRIIGVMLCLCVVSLSAGVVCGAWPSTTEAASWASRHLPPPPTITGFSPTLGPPGTTVSISGANLSGARSVAFDGVASVSFSVASATLITATVPTDARTGRITVATPGGYVDSQGIYTVTSGSSSPSVTGFSPTSGPPGTAVTITGANLSNPRSVAFGGVASLPGEFTALSSTQISATVPPSAVTGVISIATAAGTASSVGIFAVTTPPPVAPKIVSLAPTFGPVGTLVTVTGSGFTNVTSVAFTGAGATSFTALSTSQITTFVPLGAISGPVSVTTTAGTARSTASFTVTSSPLPTPTITGFSPRSGRIGATVTITGRNLSGVTSVTFGGRRANFSVHSNTRVQAIVPNGARTGQIKLTTGAGSATGPGRFVVVPATPRPVITGFSPHSGRVGDVVMISGRNFTGATSLSFGGRRANLFVRSSTSIKTAVPSGARSGRITVTTKGGTAASSGRFVVTSR